MKQDSSQSQIVKTARTAGIWYLCLAISGVLGFLIFHPEIYKSEAQQTLKSLIDKESIARTRLLLEFAIIISQALAALWFYRLFKDINNWAASAIGIWGTVNAVMIMVSAIAMGSAIEIAASSQAFESKIILVELLSSIISNAWAVGGLFFGLWLIPMGYIINSSKRMPIWLGRLLMIGGVGYVASTCSNYLGLSGEWIDYLTIPATIGEFWMIGYLFIFGIRARD